MHFYIFWFHFCFYKGLNKNSFLLIVVFIFPIKILIVFLLKFIILKILSANGPEPNLYSELIFNSNRLSEIKPLSFSSFLHFSINSFILD